MRFLAWISLSAGVIAVVALLGVVLGTPDWRSQVLAFELPLDFDEPETTLLFVPSIVLGSLAIAMGGTAVRSPLARAGLAMGVASWLGVLAAMGVSGLRVLF